ncbi:TonB-dependent receptor [Sphingomonas sp. NY01]|uniref:TonB-dependent receptor domain-containing protein n=1 Tax=Sphingomonas sp. NY01 TaxID=2968057 RepID=UPI00315D6EF9
MLKQSVSSLALASALMMFAVPAWGAQTTSPSTQTSNDDADGDDADQGGSAQGSLAAEAADTRAAAIRGQATATDDGVLIVTGTRIARPNTSSASPITSVTAQDIQAQGPLNVEEVLNRLPQIAPDSQQNYQDSDGRQRLKLRNLGFERTLVLLDGKRLGTQNGQDTNIIPASLLERIDVLSGGASSVYGSDAVSGVINFILRKDFDGLRIDGNYNFYNHNNRETFVTPLARTNGFATPLGLTNDGGRADITITAGKKMLDDRLRVSTFFNYRTADQVNYSDRSYSPCYIQETVRNGPVACTPLSSYSSSGFILPRGGPTAGQSFVNNPNGSRTFVAFGPGRGNAANPYEFTPLQRESESFTGGAFFNFKIAPEVEVYADALWFRNESRNGSPLRVYSSTVFGSTPYQVNCDNPFLSGSQANTLCGTNAGRAGTFAPLDVRYRFDGQPLQTNTFTNKGIRATGGVRGNVGEAWTYDIGGVYAFNRMDTAYARFSDPVRVNRALDVVNVNGTPTCRSVVTGTDRACLPFDAFRAGFNDTAAINYMFGGATDGAVNSGGELYNVISTVTGDLGKYGITSPWAEDGLAIALGAEYREDRFFSGANEAYRVQYGNNEADLRQHVWESNIEIQAPLMQDRRFAHLLQANGGFRVSKYSTNPSVFTTWKVEGLYAPVRDITFRASYNKAQRAPTVIEIRQATQQTYRTLAVTDFCAPTVNANGTRGAPIASREVCRATGLSDALYGSETLICPDNTCTARSGGWTADPETAYTLTYGLVLQPSFIPGLFFSVDRYQIRLNGSLGYQEASYFAEGCVASNGDPFFCRGVVRDPVTGILYNAPGTNPTSGFFREGTTNLYRTLGNGWDFQGQYTLRMQQAGRIDLNFNGSLTTLAGAQDSPLRPQYNCAGYFSNGVACGQLIPKWSHTMRTTYTTPDSVFNISFNWRHTGPLTSADNSGDPTIGGTAARRRTTYFRIGAQDFFDVSMAFNVSRQFALRLAANNVFDRDPPIIQNSRQAALTFNNTLPQRYDALGRQIVIGATMNF